jgi:hypothetical protein
MASDGGTGQVLDGGQVPDGGRRTQPTKISATRRPSTVSVARAPAPNPSPTPNTASGSSNVLYTLLFGVVAFGVFSIYYFGGGYSFFEKNDPIGAALSSVFVWDILLFIMFITISYLQVNSNALNKRPYEIILIGLTFLFSFISMVLLIQKLINKYDSKTKSQTSASAGGSTDSPQALSATTISLIFFIIAFIVTAVFLGFTIYNARKSYS